MKSDRKFFRVNFKSNDRYDATGFQATYQFTDRGSQLTLRNIRSNGNGKEVFANLVIMIVLLLVSLH